MNILKYCKQNRCIFRFDWTWWRMRKMAANDDRVVSEILSRTIEYDPKTNVALMYSLLARKGVCICDAHVANVESEEGVVKICTGSTVELRIKPLLSCIGDVDIMYHCTDSIALPRDCKDLQTRKLKGMNSTLELFLMVPSPDYPGYTNMYVGGLLSWNTQTNRYHLTTQEQVISSLSNFGESNLYSIYNLHSIIPRQFFTVHPTRSARSSSCLSLSIHVVNTHLKLTTDL